MCSLRSCRLGRRRDFSFSSNPAAGVHDLRCQLMTALPITIARAALTDDASRALIGELNAELSRTYPEPGANHFGLDPDEVAEGRGAFLLVYRDGVPVGCDAETGELKRMYVSPAVRGSGLGRRLVAALEAEARALGVRRLVLETGTRQLAAMALYRATGFHPIPLYGEYLSSPETSVCLGKELHQDQTT
jgi:putative acetyltransferase